MGDRIGCARQHAKQIVSSGDCGLADAGSGRADRLSYCTHRHCDSDSLHLVEPAITNHDRQRGTILTAADRTFFCNESSQKTRLVPEQQLYSSPLVLREPITQLGHFFGSYDRMRDSAST